MKNPSHRILPALLVAWVILFSGPERATADEIALTVPGSQIGLLMTSEFVGYRFTVNSAVWLTGLGYYDRDGDGLISSHLVQLWNVGTQQPIVSRLVPSGTGALLLNNFRFVSLDTPISLQVGTTYVVVGQFVNGDGDPLGTTNSPQMSSAVNYVSGAHSNSSNPLIFPGEQSGSLYAGGNFTYAVPEPSVSLMIALGILGLLARRQRMA